MALILIEQITVYSNRLEGVMDILIVIETIINQVTIGCDYLYV